MFWALLGGASAEERPPPSPPKDKGKAVAKHKPKKRKIDPPSL